MSDILLKQKDYEELSQSIFDLNLKIMEKDKEIERLNNIINELEKWIKEDTEKYMITMETGRAFNMFDILDKLQELKGSDKE